jgi:hypothetical protein
MITLVFKVHRFTIDNAKIMKQPINQDDITLVPPITSPTMQVENVQVTPIYAGGIDSESESESESDTEKMSFEENLDHIEDVGFSYNKENFGMLF